MSTVVYVDLDPEEYDFMIRFDPDRERSANRRELVEVIEWMQTVLVEGYQGVSGE